MGFTLRKNRWKVAYIVFTNRLRIKVLWNSGEKLETAGGKQRHEKNKSNKLFLN